jgi:flagella basal body P-ring formation protein FlgA
MGAACAGVRQDAAEIKDIAEAYALRETQGLPGQVQVSVQLSESRFNLAPCAAMESSLAPGSRWWGRANVIVRCVAGASWSVYVPVQVRIMGQYVIAARPLAGNQALESTDLALQNGDLAQIGPGALTDVAQAVGKTLAIGLASGQPLRQEALRAAQVLAQGQNVKLVSKGQGFSVSAEGKAVTSAREGQVVQVRTISNQIVSGVARSGGMVEVSF